jgi:acyl carrier protein
MRLDLVELILRIEEIFLKGLPDEKCELIQTLPSTAPYARRD